MTILRRLTTMLGIAAASTAIAAPQVQTKPEQAVVVHFAYGSTDLNRLFELEDKLKTAITKAGVGEYDGHEIAVDGSDGDLYMYGSDADRLFVVVKPILQATPFMHGAKVKKRYGPPGDGVRETIVFINP